MATAVISFITGVVLIPIIDIIRVKFPILNTKTGWLRLLSVVLCALLGILVVVGKYFITQYQTGVVLGVEDLAKYALNSASIILATSQTLFTIVWEQLDIHTEVTELK